MRLFLVGFVALAAVHALSAQVTLASLFTDHAVLQRDKPVPVWGTAPAGEHVVVTYAGHQGSATAGNDGQWIVLLDPFSALATGSDLVATGQTTATVHDVVVGDVWLASGQSNMEFTVADPTGPVYQVEDAAAEVAAADHPLIRQFKVAPAESDQPSRTAAGQWVPCSPATVGRFSAVAYFFARDLQRRVAVPIGIINSTWGGTPVEAWLSPSALAADPRFAVVFRRWARVLKDYPAAQAAWVGQRADWERQEREARARGGAAWALFQHAHAGAPAPPPGPGSPLTPAGLFNGMINPLLPYALRGMLWYQGEANTPRATEYHALFAAMITAWREHFGQGDLPFYWVQLAAFDETSDSTGSSWAYLREAQSAALSLPATGQAVAIDLGEPANIHPRNKREVGRRLALIAKAKIYDVPVDYSGPEFAGVMPDGHGLRVHFRFADNGLTAAGQPLQSFELAGADRRFHPAAATIAGATVYVESPAVPAPVAVRYAWRNAPVANLYNGAGLPAAPFRSDAW